MLFMPSLSGKQLFPPSSPEGVLGFEALQCERPMPRRTKIVAAEERWSHMRRRILMGRGRRYPTIVG
jgi:hypothetical protein